MFPGHRVVGEVRRITTDAAPSIIGAVGWNNSAYIIVSEAETMAPFAEEDGRMAGLAAKDLMGLAIGSVAGFAAHPDTVLFVGVDNMNDVCWVVKGKTRRKFDRELLIAFFISARSRSSRLLPRDEPHRNGGRYRESGIRKSEDVGGRGRGYQESYSRSLANVQSIRSGSGLGGGVWVLRPPLELTDEIITHRMGRKQNGALPRTQ